MSSPFEVTWDYLCPFARNAHEHLAVGLQAGAGWDVPDPVGGDPDDYERTLALVRTAMPGVLAAVMGAGRLQ